VQQPDGTQQAIGAQHVKGTQQVIRTQQPDRTQHADWLLVSGEADCMVQLLVIRYGAAVPQPLPIKQTEEASKGRKNSSNGCETSP
jgi:hypothetical protein